MRRAWTYFYFIQEPTVLWWNGYLWLV
jgi:hypothetical protein